MDKDLIQENQKLKEMVSLKSNFISMTAHEIRTSATALKWILRMLLDKDAGPISAEQETLLKKAYESNERAIGMVSDMILANKSDDATISYKFEETDVLKLVEDVISDFASEAYKLNIAITFDKPEGKIPYLKIDPAKIRIVLQNLLDNSIKYSDKGDRIDISVSKEDSAVKFTVRDTGIGIKAADQPSIFNKFFRAENARARKTVGTGLGLTTTKEIIERHGGKIWFESKEGVGTTFYFTLPIA